MILEIYGVLDAAVKAYLPPLFVRSRGEAIRTFTTAVNTADHQFHKHAADYALVYFGTWDDGTGLFSPAPGPERLLNATDVLEDDVFPPGARIQQ